MGGRSVRGIAYNNTPKDTGCSLHPTCLTCPFIICRYDLKTFGFRSFPELDRHQKVLDLRREGVDARKIASLVGCSKRNIYRITQKYGDGNVIDTLIPITQIR